ncbi:MAG: hypothetical protein ACRDTA_08665 [Pseudonocardiaceae bacterium]
MSIPAIRPLGHADQRHIFARLWGGGLSDAEVVAVRRRLLAP